MEVLVKLLLNIFDLTVFAYYFNTYKKTKRIPLLVMVLTVVTLTGLWTFINMQQKPMWNLAGLLFSLILISFLYESRMISRLVMIAAFVGVGFLLEPFGGVLLKIMRTRSPMPGSTLLYFVSVLLSFVRANIIYWMCKVGGSKKLHITTLPKEIIGVLILIPVIVIINCCFVIEIAIDAGHFSSMVICICLIISMVLTFYFMLYMMERFSYLTQKKHEHELYLEELDYKEEYYNEVEKQNEYVKNLKHNMKNQLSELLYLVEQNNVDKLKKRLYEVNEGLEMVDSNIYCENPKVNSVLRIKLGMAKAENIRTDISVRIPKKMKMENGDIGVLYGNLLDNAIEACRKLPAEERYIRLDSKYSEGMLLLIVENSKTVEENPTLHTTKRNKELHGRGISSVRMVIEKYSGTLNFEDKGNLFEASAILYHIKAEQ